MIGFCHVPKTGGTSLVTGLRAAGRNVYAQGTTKDRMPWAPDGPLEIPRDTEVVTGHIPVEHWGMFKCDQWVTVLRDPIERWVSHYYWLNKGAESLVGWQLPPDDLMCRLFSVERNPYEAASVVASMPWWTTTDSLGDAAAMLGVSLPPEMHKVSGRPDPIPPELADMAIGHCLQDLALWELLS